MAISKETNIRGTRNIVAKKLFKIIKILKITLNIIEIVIINRIAIKNIFDVSCITKNGFWIQNSSVPKKPRP